LISSEKVLVGEAQILRSELENTAGDLYGLFSKLGLSPIPIPCLGLSEDIVIYMRACHQFSERKEKVEDANRSIVQHFHSQLTQDMSVLHRAVSTSVYQQESLLNSLEEEMKSFLSSKGKVH